VQGLQEPTAHIKDDTKISLPAQNRKIPRKWMEPKDHQGRSLRAGRGSTAPT
jgi:hypothetical protein